jgi:hypothetical protein
MPQGLGFTGFHFVCLLQWILGTPLLSGMKYTVISSDLDTEGYECC